MNVQYLIIGSETLVGSALSQLLTDNEMTFAALQTQEIEFTHSALTRTLKKYRPQYVINTNLCMSDEDQSIFTPTAAQVLASACADFNEPLLQLSSNQVFNDDKASYSEKDEPNGDTKVAKVQRQVEESIIGFCEKYILLRVAWIFSDKGEDILAKLLELLRNNSELSASDKRIVTPTLAEDVARVIVALLKQIDYSDELWGVYHYTGTEPTNLLEFMNAVLGEAGQFEKLAVETVESDDAAAWHKLIPETNSVLACRHILHTFGIKQRPWRQGLSKVLRTMYIRPAAEQ